VKNEEEISEYMVSQVRFELDASQTEVDCIITKLSLFIWTVKTMLEHYSILHLS
jgi:hypothetical protein